MKSKMIYVYVFVGTLVLAEVLMMLVATIKPEIFEGTKAAADSSAVGDLRKPAADTSRALQPDSAKVEENAGALRGEANTMSSALVQKTDSIALLLSKLQASEKKIAELDPKIRAASVPAAVNDSTKVKDRRMLVKMLETMSPESAARIVESFQDSDARAILMGIKAKQAGKILSAINPDRASKLMR